MPDDLDRTEFRLFPAVHACFVCLEDSAGQATVRRMTIEPEPKRSEDHEFPFMELFNAEDAIDNPGETLEDLDTTDDSDAPAP